jgi:quercetin dioxygenase-like cupin family protein
MDIINNTQLIKNMEHNKVIKLKDVVGYKAGMVSSLAIAARPGVNMTLFSFEKGEEISTHAAPGDAFVTILEGEVDITINGEISHLKEGDAIVMPAGAPHALQATTRFKMMLVVVK